MREVELKAGEKTKVLHLMARNFRTRIEFEVETKDGSPPRGEIALSHGSTIVGRKTATVPLEALNQFEKRWNQHGFQIHVTAESDATARFHTRHIREVHIYRAMAVITLVGIGLMLMAWLAKSG